MEALANWAKGIDLYWIITELFVVLTAVIALTVHECSHAFAAMLLGDDTAKRMGRLTLNPLKHVSLSGLLMLAVFHFGWAKPVPADMRRFKNPKVGMALTALAGPVSNVFLALLGCVVKHFLITVLWNARDSVIAGASVLYYVCLFVEIFTLLNAGLAVFNLLPISPLDGSKILGIILPQNAYAWLMRYERYGMFVLIALLLLGVLDGPLEFLRSGLLNGLNVVAALPFPPHPLFLY